MNSLTRITCRTLPAVLFPTRRCRIWTAIKPYLDRLQVRLQSHPVRSPGLQSIGLTCTDCRSDSSLILSAFPASSLLASPVQTAGQTPVSSCRPVRPPVSRWPESPCGAPQPGQQSAHPAGEETGRRGVRQIHGSRSLEVVSGLELRKH